MSLLIASEHRVLHLTLDRPEKRNALNTEMCKGIVDAIEGVQRRSDIACILLTASGPVFCAGMDLNEAGSVDRSRLTALHESLFTLGARSVKPIVISVNGAALGGGLGLAAQGHVVFAGEEAVFGLPEINVGLWPFLVYRSVGAAIGRRQTLALALSGELFTAAQAAEWGLVHRVLAIADVDDRCMNVAQRLARASPLALQLGMKYVHQSDGKSWTEAGELAAALRVKLMESEDFKEGRRAFKEKREPRWPSMP